MKSALGELEGEKQLLLTKMGWEEGEQNSWILVEKQESGGGTQLRCPEGPSGHHDRLPSGT